MRNQYLSLYQKLPADRRLWNYGMNGLKIRPELDAFTKAYLEQYHSKEVNALKEQLRGYESLLE